MDLKERLRQILAEMDAMDAAPAESPEDGPTDAPNSKEIAPPENTEAAVPETEEMAPTNGDGGNKQIEPSTVENTEIIAPAPPVDITVVGGDSEENGNGAGIEFRFAEQAKKITGLENALADIVFRLNKLEANVGTVYEAIDTAAEVSPAAQDIASLVRQL